MICQEKERVEHPEEYTIVRVAGDIDIYTATRLETHLETLDRAVIGVIIDLTKTTYFDAAGCKWLIRMFERAEEVGKHLRVHVEDKSQTHRVLKILKLDEHIPIEPFAAN